MDKKNLDLAVDLRRELHQHPEISNHGTWTKNRLMDFLIDNTKLEIVDKGNMVYNLYSD